MKTLCRKEKKMVVTPLIKLSFHFNDELFNVFVTELPVNGLKCMHMWVGVVLGCWCFYSLGPEVGSRSSTIGGKYFGHSKEGGRFSEGH
jgi:hypothetical protein